MKAGAYSFELCLMILNELALILCLGLLFFTKAVLMRAVKLRDQQQIRVLLLFRIGLGLSACSYIIHLWGTTAGLIRLASFLCTLAGSVFIWIGTMEHWKLYQERLHNRAAIQDEEIDDGRMFEDSHPTRPDLPCLNSQVRRVLWHALADAHQQRQCCVDTDHLLCGLLQEPNSAGADILKRLHIKRENIQPSLRALESESGPPAIERLPLTDRAQQVLILAGQEAHRFEKTSVGTDHLLLGLVLVGASDAALSLFRAGVTVDAVRSEIQKHQKRDFRKDSG